MPIADDRKTLIEARRTINRLALTCRQSLVYLEGQSAMDKRKVSGKLRDAAREAEAFLNRQPKEGPVISGNSGGG